MMTTGFARVLDTSPQLPSMRFWLNTTNRPRLDVVIVTVCDNADQRGGTLSEAIRGRGSLRTGLDGVTTAYCHDLAVGSTSHQRSTRRMSTSQKSPVLLFCCGDLERVRRIIQF